MTASIPTRCAWLPTTTAGVRCERASQCLYSSSRRPRQQQPVSACAEAAHDTALAEVVLRRDDVDVGCGVLSSKCEGEGCGGILGAIVNDDESVGARGRGDVCEGGEALAGTERGNRT